MTFYITTTKVLDYCGYETPNEDEETVEDCNVDWCQFEIENTPEKNGEKNEDVKKHDDYTK